MKFFKKFNQKLVKKENRGFTLVELMVVVGIIGILSSVAIPNFRDYQSKTKTSEAKLLLSALYTAESAVISDYDMYVTCIEHIGMDNSGKYYSVGFVGQGTGVAVNTNSELAGLTGCNGVPATAMLLHPLNGNIVGGVDNATANDASATTGVWQSGSSFVASARGHIEPKASSVNVSSVWILNSNKMIVQINKGYSSIPGVVGALDVAATPACAPAGIPLTNICDDA